MADRFAVLFLHHHIIENSEQTFRLRFAHSQCASEYQEGLARGHWSGWRAFFLFFLPRILLSCAYWLITGRQFLMIWVVAFLFLLAKYHSRQCNRDIAFRGKEPRWKDYRSFVVISLLQLQSVVDLHGKSEVRTSGRWMLRATWVDVHIFKKHSCPPIEMNKYRSGVQGDRLAEINEAL